MGQPLVGALALHTVQHFECHPVGSFHFAKSCEELAGLASLNGALCAELCQPQLPPGVTGHQEHVWLDVPIVLSISLPLQKPVACHKVFALNMPFVLMGVLPGPKRLFCGVSVSV